MARTPRNQHTNQADDSSIIVNDVNIGHLTGEEEKENPKNL